MISFEFLEFNNDFWVDLEVNPCHGEPALKDPNTGEDLECGNGPTRTNCPDGSFCHRSQTFAKCCKTREYKL